jgi:plastocyanin
MKVLLAVACLAVIAGGASSSAGLRPAATAPARAHFVQVEMKHIRFRPKRVVVRLGQTVRWINHDQVAHTVAAQRPNIASEAIDPGGTFRYRPRRRGTIRYFCTIHANQNGVLIVR